MVAIVGHKPGNTGPLADSGYMLRAEYYIAGESWIGHPFKSFTEDSSLAAKTEYE